MSNISKIKVGTTEYDIKDNVSGYVTNTASNLTNYYTKTNIDDTLEDLQEEIEAEIPTKTSELTNDSNFATTAQLGGKQDTLVSGTNIKTINNTSLLGSGNIDVSAGDLNKVTDVKVNGSSILVDKVANFYTSTEYSSSNPLTTNDELEEVREDLEAQLPQSIGKVEGTTNQYYHKTECDTYHPLYSLNVDGNYEQDTTTGKNLLPDNATTQTINGITFTKNSDGSITCNGTATADANLLIGTTTLSAGTYKANHFINGSTSTYYIRLGEGTTTSSTFIANVGSGDNTFTLSTSKTVGAILIIRSGQIISNLVFKPMISIEGGDYEPYTGGIASPNPDYPQPISVVTGTVTETLCGKNILKLGSGDITQNNAVLTINNDILNFKTIGTTEYVAFGIDNALRKANYGDYVAWGNQILKAGTYTLSYKYINGVIETGTTGANFTRLNIYGRSIGNTDRVKNTLAQVYITTTSSSVTFVLDEDKEVNVVFYMYAPNPNNDFNIQVQLEQGATATDYEAYKSKSVSIALGDNELCALPNGVKDELDFKTGILTKRVGKIVLDGSESWKLRTSGVNCYQGVRLTNCKAVWETQSSYMNYFSYNTNAAYYGNDGYGIDRNSQVVIGITSVSTLADFKTWLSTHNTTVYYELATPTTVQLTAVTMPTPYEETNFLTTTSIDTNSCLEYFTTSKIIPSMTSQLINDSGFIDLNDLSNYSLITDAGNSIVMSVDSSDYILTTQLKNKDGNTISTATVNLPIEADVVNGRYDTTNKNIILTKRDGSTITFSIADLISGLQSEITSTNKLDSDLINTTGQTNQFVLASDKTAWNAKQNAISAGTGITLSGSQVSVTDYDNILASIASKQTTLVSGTNIKTINNESILGSGNIDIQGGSGTSNYNSLTNKPQINGVELSGNKTTAQLGLFSGNYTDLTNKPTIPDSTSDLTNDSGFITATSYATSTVGGTVKMRYDSTTGTLYIRNDGTDA